MFDPKYAAMGIIRRAKPKPNFDHTRRSKPAEVTEVVPEVNMDIKDRYGGRFTLPADGQQQSSRGAGGTSIFRQQIMEASKDVNGPINKKKAGKPLVPFVDKMMQRKAVDFNYNLKEIIKA